MTINNLAAAADAYAAGQPMLTDDQWDRMAGDTPWESPGAVMHVSPILSLEKLTSWEDVLLWCAAACPCVVCPKIDGVAIVLYYEEGHLRRALTRGDGVRGHHATTPCNVPKFIDGFTGAVRGEALGRSCEGYTSQRSAAVGSLARGEALLFIAFDILNSFPRTYLTVLAQLRAWGFQTPPTFGSHLCMWEQLRAYPYVCDGIVITMNADDRMARGTTAHHPRWAVAFKWAGSRATTTIVGVRWRVSKVGRMVPTLLLAPVVIGDVTARAATGHNAQNVARMSVGDVVEVVRAGDIVPQVVGHIARGVGATLSLPSECLCGASLRGDRCTRINCPEARAARAVHIARGLGFKGLGPRKARTLPDGPLADVLWAVDPAQWARLKKAGRLSPAAFKKVGLPTPLWSSEETTEVTRQGVLISITGEVAAARSEVAALLAYEGIQVVAFAKRNAFLFTGEKAGPSKLRRAEGWGLRVIKIPKAARTLHECVRFITEVVHGRQA